MKTNKTHTHTYIYIYIVFFYISFLSAGVAASREFIFGTRFWKKCTLNKTIRVSIVFRLNKTIRVSIVYKLNKTIRVSTVYKLNKTIRVSKSDAGDDDDGGFPTTLPAWQVPEGITHKNQISRSGNPSVGSNMHAIKAYSLYIKHTTKVWYTIS